MDRPIRKSSSRRLKSSLLSARMSSTPAEKRQSALHQNVKLRTMHKSPLVKKLIKVPLEKANALKKRKINKKRTILTLKIKRSLRERLMRMAGTLLSRLRWKPQ